MKIKIRGGTARADEPSLCLSCRHATVVRGEARDEELVQCDELYGSRGYLMVRFRVTHCNKYLNSNAQSIREMEQMAWILRTDPGKEAIGFMPMKKLTDRERSKLKPLEELEDD
jgi:hypothetical protein